jgi:hypothetical protein
MRRKTMIVLEVTHEDTDYNLACQIDNAVKQIPKVVSLRIQMTLPPTK